MLTQEQALWLQITTIIAILISPITAVCITLWYQNRHEKRNIKFNTFHTIISYRDAIPPSPYLVTALNTIDVVFYDCPKVLHLWHQYYDILYQPQETVDIQNRKRKFLDLILEMSKTLGYTNINQTEFDKYYTPIYQAEQANLSYEIQRELLRVLKTTGVILTAPRIDPLPTTKKT
ncbi:MAG: DUF6680 family protein [Ignavibacteria bacterium]|jgi:hypothetical protein